MNHLPGPYTFDTETGRFYRPVMSHNNQSTEAFATMTYCGEEDRYRQEYHQALATGHLMSQADRMLAQLKLNQRWFETMRGWFDLLGAKGASKLAGNAAGFTEKIINESDKDFTPSK